MPSGALRRASSAAQAPCGTCSVMKRSMRDLRVVCPASRGYVGARIQAGFPLTHPFPGGFFGVEGRGFAHAVNTNTCLASTAALPEARHGLEEKESGANKEADG